MNGPPPKLKKEMLYDPRPDILRIAEQYQTQRKYLVDALNRVGLPSAWLISWDAKLERLAAWAREKE